MLSDGMGSGQYKDWPDTRFNLCIQQLRRDSIMDGTCIENYHIWETWCQNSSRCH